MAGIELEDIVRILASKEQEKPLAPKFNVSSLLNIFPVAVTLAGMLYMAGDQDRALKESVKMVRSELQTEFIRELSSYKDEARKEIEFVRQEVNKQRDLKANLERMVDDLEESQQESEDKIRILQRTVDEQHRKITYLQSQHNVAIPPNYNK